MIHERRLLARGLGAARHYRKMATRPLIRMLASSRIARKPLNGLHNAMSFEARAQFHEAYAKIFYPQLSGQNGFWLSHFNGHMLKLPLATPSFARDWDLAVSITAHDWEVKRTYELLLQDRAIDLFVDIGANFGTHSLLFLVSGVPAVSFEPNADCCAHFAELAALNGLDADIRNVALGAAPGWATLRFPEGKSWLGSIMRENDTHAMLKQKVEVRTLDSYRLQGRMLIKIDAEGAELDILRGGMETIGSQRPLIIFESLDLDERHDYQAFFVERGYVIQGLPLGQQSDFLYSPQTNFIAVPRERFAT